MEKAKPILRILFGLILVVFGLNKFLNFMPALEPQGDAASYLGGLMASGFTFPVIAIVEIATGILLLIGKYVPLALVLYAPISVNIILYHIVLDLPNIVLGGAVFALNLILLFMNKSAYEKLLSP